MLRGTFPGREQRRFAVVFVVTFLVSFVSTYEYIQGVESRPFNELFAGTFAFLATVGALAAYRFIRVWFEARTFLAGLELRSLRDVFSHIGCEHSWSLLFARSDQTCPLTRYRELARTIQRSEDYDRCTEIFKHAVKLIADFPDRRTEESEDQVTVAVEIAKSEIYDRVDERGYVRPRRRHEGQVEAPLAVFKTEGEKDLETTTMEFVTLPAYEFIVYVLGQMRTLLFFFSGSFVLAAVSLLVVSVLRQRADHERPGGELRSGRRHRSPGFWPTSTRIRSSAASTVRSPAKSGSVHPGGVTFGLLPLVTVLAAYFPDLAVS